MSLENFCKSATYNNPYFLGLNTCTEITRLRSPIKSKISFFALKVSSKLLRPSDSLLICWLDWRCVQISLELISSQVSIGLSVSTIKTALSGTK